MSSHLHGLDGPFLQQPAVTGPATVEASHAVQSQGELEEFAIPTPLEAARQANNLAGQRDLAEAALTQTYATNTTTWPKLWAAKHLIAWKRRKEFGLHAE